VENPQERESPVAENHGATPPEVTGTEGSPTEEVGDGRMTEEEHFAIDQRIRQAIGEHKRVEEIMKETGLSRAAVYRHLKHIREELREWLWERRGEHALLLATAIIEGVECQIRYLIEAEKVATTVQDKTRLALAILQLEGALAELVIHDKD
jgi:AraC-like DNA-binding protein